MAKKEDNPSPGSPRILNRKAWHDYHVLEKLECGIELTGTEVKSLRAGQGRIDEAHARLVGDDLVLFGANIAMYPQAAPGMQHEPTRERRLLVHRRQIAVLRAHVQQKGRTLVPLALYFRRGWAKLELGLVEGKRLFDKREALRTRDAKRDMARELGRRRRA
jgi:SsrA-binding protein